MLSVARATVTTAYDQLTAEGYLASAHGSGTFVSRDVPDRPATRIRIAPDPATAPAIRLSRFAARLDAAYSRPDPDHAPGTIDLSKYSPDVDQFPLRVWRRLILRHGALMPLYMVALYDLALGRGLAARVFSLPGMAFLGQLSFSIFIWQNLFMALGFMMIMAAPNVPDGSFLFAVIGLLGMSMISTFFIEKPLARRLRKRFAAVRESAGVPAADGREAS